MSAQYNLASLNQVRREIYRASSEMDSLLDEELSRWLDEVAMYNRCLSVKKPGSLGCGSVISLLSIRTTFDILGLSSGLCCTHNRATWTDRNTSDILLLFLFSIDVCISSNVLPSLWSLQACFRILVSSFVKFN